MDNYLNRYRKRAVARKQSRAEELNYRKLASPKNHFAASQSRYDLAVRPKIELRRYTPYLLSI